MNPRLLRLLVGLTVFVAFNAAAAETPAATEVAPVPVPVTPSMTDSAAHIAVKKLPRDVLLRPIRRFGPPDESAPTEVIRLDEIRVYGRSDPADYLREELPPMLKFRAQLDRQRPRTPKEITQGALCLIGLCAVEPVDITSHTRSEQQAHRSSVELATQFRGTLQ